MLPFIPNQPPQPLHFYVWIICLSLLTTLMAPQLAKVFSKTSERVKSVDVHPTEPWIMTSLYSGNLCIWNYESQALEKSLKVTEAPVRTAKFIARKKWIVTGADDRKIRVYNYETMEMVKEFEGHEDYIRCIVVHPSLPLALSSSDDKLVKMWDWERDWECTHTFHGHSHYVMHLAFNPIHSDVFASASLDGTLKVWKFGSPSPTLTLEGHTKGVNCVDYFLVDGEPHLLSASDDFTLKVWDSENGCLKTLEGHTNNVTAICAHPDLPLFISTSEDSTICTWEAKTYRLVNTINYGFERVWAVGSRKGLDKIAFGCDNGMVMTKFTAEPNIQQD